MQHLLCAVLWITKVGCGPVVIAASDRSKQGGPLQWAHPLRTQWSALDPWVKLRCHVLPHRLLSPSCTDLSGPGCPRVVAVLFCRTRTQCFWAEGEETPIEREPLSCTSAMSASTNVCLPSYTHLHQSSRTFYSVLSSARLWRGQASTQRSRLRTVVISEWLQHPCLL